MLLKDRPRSESRQNVDFYVRPAFRVLVLPIKGFTAYYTAFNSSFRVSSETDSMGSPIIYKAKLTWFFVVNFTSAVLEVNTRNMYSFQNLEIWWQSSFVYFQLGFRKIAKASIDEPPLMHWTHLFLISSYDFISCSTKASSLSFSVSISCWSMSIVQWHLFSEKLTETWELFLNIKMPYFEYIQTSRKTVKELSSVCWFLQESELSKTTTCG